MSFLNLFGGGDSPETNNFTDESMRFTDSGSYARDNAIAINFAPVGENNTLTNNITTLDGDVARYAMDTALTATQDALLFGANAEKNAYDFAGQSLNFAAASNAATMAFAGAQTQAANATTKSAIDSTATAYQKALAFGSQQTGVALDALAGSAAMIDTAYKDAKWVLGTNVILVGIGATVLVLYFALRKKA